LVCIIDNLTQDDAFPDNLYTQKHVFPMKMICNDVQKIK
jgi:hypothetical protein